MYVARFESAPLTLYPAHSRVDKNNLVTWHSLSTQDCHILPDAMDDRSHYHLEEAGTRRKNNSVRYSGTYSPALIEKRYQKSSIIPAKHMRREQQKEVDKAQSVDRPFGMLS